MSVNFRYVDLLQRDPLDTLGECSGFYERRGNGPLVGYAGWYTNDAGQSLHFVGEVYANFAKAEQHPVVMRAWSERLSPRILEVLPEVDLVLGAPMGGILFANALANQLGCRVAFAEKKVTAVETPTEREETVLVLGRHDIIPGERVLIAEDVCNNFSTTEEMVQLIKSHGAFPDGIACELNRSKHDEYQSEDGALPVISLVRKQFASYRQDDPYVAADVAKGNVVWKPKKPEEWAKLLEAANRAQAAKG